jgi:hypothetical protein
LILDLDIVVLPNRILIRFVQLGTFKKNSFCLMITNRFIIILILISIKALALSQTAIITDDPTYTSGIASSVLDVKSTTKGIMIPRVSLIERGMISNPATGLLVFQTDNTPGYYYYNGSQWSSVGAGTSPDGSETKVNSGTNLAIGGSGTTGSPYTVTYSSQSVTQDQRNSISSPYAGQFVWCNNCGTAGEYQVYNGSAWTNMCGGSAMPVMPTVTTTTVTSILGTTATSGGNVTSEGGGSVSARGVCWNTSANPTISNNKTTDGSGQGVFSSSLTGLTPNTTYYVRAYATNAAGTSYGAELNFVTVASAPTVTTTTISSITSTTASGGGNVTSSGGASVTAYGVCWNTTGTPTVSNSKTTDGSGTGSFTSALTSLSSGTTYYVRAYATNSVGTSYGSQEVFATTTVVLPTVTTTTPYDISNFQVYSGGNVTSDGGGTILARGICMSTSANPTIANSPTNDGSGIGSFTSYKSGLSSGTTYHIRAYAQNTAGVAYGSDIAFIALSLGDSFQGGLVAYLLTVGDPGYDTQVPHGIIAASADQFSIYTWWNGGYVITGASGTALGTGASNTTRIVSVQGAGPYAASICNDLVLNSYSDWYLPSNDELYKLYNARAYIGLSTNEYWSSSEYSSDTLYQARFVIGSGGTQSYGYKSSLKYLRAIRSF